jgi:hypothetical protein
MYFCVQAHLIRVMIAFRAASVALRLELPVCSKSNTYITKTISHFRDCQTCMFIVGKWKQLIFIDFALITAMCLSDASVRIANL